MNTSFILYYVLIFTAMTTLLFVAYRLIFSNAENFKLQRIMLLSILGLSLLMPFNPIKITMPAISLNIEKTFFNSVKQAVELETVAETETTENFTEQTHPIPIQSTEKENTRTWSFATILLWIYLLVSFLLIVRLLLNIAQLIYWYYAFPKTRKGKYRLVQLPADKSTCSFFNCIFINENGLDEFEKQQIIKHEKIHASQYHSLDILLIELIGAVMWFNPFIWMIKREIRLVHEYLADDEVPTSDSEKIHYQALLLNQVTGGKIISFSSQFKQSIIKKRIMMMEKQKSSKKMGRKLLWFLPVVLLFVLGTAWVNGQASNEKVKQELVSAANEKLIETALTKLFDSQVVDKTAVIDVNITNKAKPTRMSLVRQSCNLSVAYIYNATDENDAISKSDEFKAYPEDSKRITEMLNQKLLDKNSSDKIWANFYYYENKRNPEKGLICLNIASTTNKVNKEFMNVISEFFQLKEKGISSDVNYWGK
ncbi:MAG TPA: M56 family metallopeptidase [Bacteroidales bacterium]|nr:M56 family metallopeptidase [Bacteroidales bacterium]